jgi:hypothetical protein
MNMPISVSKYLPLHNGTIRTIGFDERPTCKHYNNPMKIISSTIVGPIVGLIENYDVQKYYYRCERVLCDGGEKKPIQAENTIYPPKSDFDYEVHAKVAEFRWRRKLTYEEIITEMKKDHGIVLNLATVKRMLKTYEIGCSQKYKQEFIRKIRKHGGVLLTIGGMRPLKGNNISKVLDYDPFILLKIRGKSKKEILIDLNLAQKSESELMSTRSNVSVEKDENVKFSFNVPKISIQEISSEKAILEDMKEISFKFKKPGKIIETLENLGIPPNIDNPKAFETVLKRIYQTISSEFYKKSMKKEKS